MDGGVEESLLAQSIPTACWAARTSQPGWLWKATHAAEAPSVTNPLPTHPPKIGRAFALSHKPTVFASPHSPLLYKLYSHFNLRQNLSMEVKCDGKGVPHLNLL